MSIQEIYQVMSDATEIVGNILIVGSFVGLVILGRAIYKAYLPKGLSIFNKDPWI